MSQSQEALMKYCPATGTRTPYPSHAEQWRSYHGKTAWLFNPWTGYKRDARDVGSDTFGLLICPAMNYIRESAGCAAGPSSQTKGEMSAFRRGYECGVRIAKKKNGFLNEKS